MTNKAIPLLSQIVLHASLNEALANIDFLLSTKEPDEGCIVPLLGPTRVGKKSVARHLLSSAGPANSLFPMDDVLYCTLPPQASGKTIYGTILDKMGVRIGPHENTKSIRDRLFRAVRQLGIKIVVIDEVNHLIERGANLAPREAADHLKTIADETGISFVLTGLPRFQRIVDENEQLRDRACATTILKPYDWQLDKERDAFTQMVDVALYKLDQAGLPVALEFEDIVRRLYGASGGRVPVMMRVLKLSAMTKQEPQPLTLRELEIASRAMQQSGIPTASFFATEEPDEVDILRSFACTMSEAGLEFSVESLAGLDLTYGANSA
ncbi:TniB family NTP-binding protein [Roseovarius aestuariivivens]|uniref:TniB family NTP-binding protein n=1 Tax=Roseovarius aestuariivivens TaxID=1888910 RepID=UPI0010822B6C|nr:TniB family NTP-binding protein [Roseovarius aestuariivivens]